MSEVGLTPLELRQCASVCAAGELMHGPIALIDPGLPVVIVVPPPGDMKVLHNKDRVPRQVGHRRIAAGARIHQIRTQQPGSAPDRLGGLIREGRVG